MKTKTINNKIIVAILIFITSLFILTGCNKILTRQATINDINIDTSQEISFNINYVMIPYVDIDDLELQFKYYDNDKNLITTKTKSVGNVKEGNQYTVSVSLTEFNFFDLFKINYTSVSVINGTVSKI